MAENSKLKILYILDVMRKTDINNPLNVTQIVKKLEGYGINAERKSVARDLACLEDAGYCILKCDNHNQGFYMVDQEFEDYELKLLADAVASAAFLDMEDSRRLLKKLKNLATKEGERIIDSTIVIDEMIKTEDKKFKLKYDLIMRAISDQQQVEFQYRDLSKGDKKIYLRGGHVYKISPYFIVPSGNAYYMIGATASHDHVLHFRVQLMENIKVTSTKARSKVELVEFKELGNKKTIDQYLRENINMWTGETITVKLRGDNTIRFDLLRRFGKNLQFKNITETEFVVEVDITNSPGLCQWLAAFGEHVSIIEPEEVRQEFVEYMNKCLARYK